MDFYEEYDPWHLYGTDDPLIDDAAYILSKEEQLEFEAWIETVNQELSNDSDIPY